MALASGHILDIARRTLPTSLEMRPRGLRRAPSSPVTLASLPLVSRVPHALD